MKIQLQDPFAAKWRLAYLRSGRDGRKRVDLFNTNTDRTTISYARYLLSVSCGRELLDDEEADHRDGDRTNDSLSNLQVVKTTKHRKKTRLERGGVKTLSLTCHNCGADFLRRDDKRRPARAFCSRPCYWTSSSVVERTVDNR